ncbi:Vacuolar protein sorting-associated protein 27 [Globisporangium polare]
MGDSSDKSALELAESSEWSALHRMVSAHPVRAEELDDFGMMPLHWACTDTHVPLRAVKVLVEAYPLAAVLKNKGGLVPLHIAVKANAKAEVLRALVAARDDALCEETPAGETPADLAQNCSLSQDKVAFLVAAEQQLRGSGRAPRRPSDRYKSLMLPVDHYKDENLASRANDGRRGSLGAGGGDETWGITGASLSSSVNKSSSSAMSSVGQLRGSAVPLPPRWRLDSRCNICQGKFNYFKNRHHCRSCGESVCSTHSNRRLPLKHIGLQTPQRVCILCYDEMREHGRPPSAVVNMYANNHGHNNNNLLRSKEQGDAHHMRKGGPTTKDDAVRSHPHNQHDAPHRGPLLRPNRSVLSLTTSSAPPESSSSYKSASSFEYHRAESTATTTTATTTSSSSPYFDDEVDPQQPRPRAWTEMDALENLSHMQSQVRELQAHVQELKLNKERLQHGITVNARTADHALQEKLIHEQTVAELRANRMLDISRLSLEDTDDDDYIKVNDDGYEEYDDENEDAHQRMDDAAADAARTCNYLGLALFEKGEFSSAVLELRKSVALHAGDPDVWYNLGRALHGAGEFCDAEIAVRRALDLTSTRSYSALSLLGKILHSKGEDDKSIDVFREALGLMDRGDNDSDSDDDVGSATVGW